MKRTTKRVGALGAATIAVMGTGIAFAAWTATGTGSGVAKGYTMTVTVSAGSVSGLTTATQQLWPGNTGASAVVALTNNNPFAVQVTGIAQTASSHITASGGKSTCPDDSITYTAPTATQLGNLLNGAVLNASESQSYELVGNVSMPATADDGCQGATFSIPVTVTEVQHANHS